MDDRDKRALRILRDALDASPAERMAFVATCCGDDPALRERVDSLLHAIAGTDLDAPDQIAIEEDPREQADALLGARLGAFRVVERIGRGGMGVVYRGIRDGDDIAQVVAIKLIRRGFDFDDVQARFLRERRILARLSHPNLARFIDGGVAADGRPWFALEFVRGVSITHWCDARKLDVRERMRLFLDVCGAVQHAHTQLVVHRDLKPGNVLVDDSGAVRLLDFGVAGLLAGDTDDGSQPSTTGQPHAMTPEYAAPEQFRGEPVGVSADVYSLGVIAYELIAGVRPNAIDRRDPAAMQALVHEGLPQSLAAAITRADASPANSAATSISPATSMRVLHPQAATRLGMRRLSLRAYRNLVRGDLNRIIDKAIASEPSRRYATVQAFADDLGRWLAGAPVHVTGNRLGYRIGKFIARNRSAVALATLALAILIAGTLGVLLKSREAVREADRATAVQSFLLSLFDSAVPGAAADSVPDTRSLLAQGVQRIDTEMRGQPLLQADLLTTMGRIHNQLNLFESAESLLGRALALQRAAGDADPLRRADTMFQLARTLAERHRYSDALPLLDEALPLVRGRDPLREADIRAKRGSVLAQDGKADAGAVEVRQALALLRAAENPAGKRTASTLDDLGFALLQGKHPEEAVDVYRESLALERVVYGGVHADIGQTLSNVGTVLLMVGRLDEAEQAMREAIAVDSKVYTSPHRIQSVHLANLAGVLFGKGDTDEATHLFRRSLDLRVALYGENDPESAKAMCNLGASLVQQESFDQAVSTLQRALRIFGTAKGDWRYWQSNAEHNLARALRGLKRWGEAEAAQRKSSELRAEIQDKNSPDLLNSYALLGEIYLDSGRLQEAKAVFEDALQRSVQNLPPGHPHLAARHTDLADCDFALGLFGEARIHYQESLRLGLAKAGERNPTMLHSRLGLGETLARLGDAVAARVQLAAAADAVAALPAGHSQRLRAEHMTILLKP